MNSNKLWETHERHQSIHHKNSADQQILKLKLTCIKNPLKKIWEQNQETNSQRLEVILEKVNLEQKAAKKLSPFPKRMQLK